MVILENKTGSELHAAEKFNYDPSNEIGFCETCIGGKHHRGPFAGSTTQTTQILELVHSDVCGKMQFLTFTDDKSRYTPCVYFEEQGPSV